MSHQGTEILANQKRKWQDSPRERRKERIEQKTEGAVTSRESSIKKLEFKKKAITTGHKSKTH